MTPSQIARALGIYSKTACLFHWNVDPSFNPIVTPLYPPRPLKSSRWDYSPVVGGNSALQLCLGRGQLGIEKHIRDQRDRQHGNPKEDDAARLEREGSGKLPGPRAKRKKLRERFQPPLHILLVSNEKNEDRGTLDPVSNPIIANAQAMGSYALTREFLDGLASMEIRIAQELDRKEDV